MALEGDLLRIAEQERAIVFPVFGELEAWHLGDLLRTACVGNQFPLVIDIRRFGQPLFFYALPGSTPDNVDWARRKANTVARFHRSSYGFGLELQSKGVTLEERYGLALNEYAAHGGAFPIRIVGAGVIGSATVSGLPQRDDHELVVRVLCDLLRLDYETLKLS